MTRNFRIVQAALDLEDAWDAHTSWDLAKHMTQDEMEALADLFVAVGNNKYAHALIEAWIESELESHEADDGDWDIETDEQERPSLLWAAKEPQP